MINEDSQGKDPIGVEAQQVALLVRLYAESTLPLDRLAYSEEFDLIVSQFQSEHGSQHTHRDLWLLLLWLRKAELLIRKGR